MKIYFDWLLISWGNINESRWKLLSILNEGVFPIGPIGLLFRNGECWDTIVVTFADEPTGVFVRLEFGKGDKAAEIVIVSFRYARGGKEVRCAMARSFGGEYILSDVKFVFNCSFGIVITGQLCSCWFVGFKQRHTRDFNCEFMPVEDG